MLLCDLIITGLCLRERVLKSSDVNTFLKEKRRGKSGKEELKKFKIFEFFLNILRENRLLLCVI